MQAQLCVRFLGFITGFWKCRDSISRPGCFSWLEDIPWAISAVGRDWCDERINVIFFFSVFRIPNRRNKYVCIHKQANLDTHLGWNSTEIRLLNGNKTKDGWLRHYGISFRKPYFCYFVLLQMFWCKKKKKKESV